MMVLCPGRNLDSSVDGSRVEVEQVLGPALRPRLEEGPQHLQVSIPIGVVDNCSFHVAQVEPCGEPLSSRHPRPELVHVTTELDDGLCQI